MAIPKKAYLSCFVPRKQIRGGDMQITAETMQTYDLQKFAAT